MPVFRYEATDTANTAHTGTLIADTPWDGRRRLREQGLRILHFQPARARSRWRWHLTGPRGRSQAPIAESARHLALLLKAGVPLAEGLAVLARQNDGRLCTILHDIRDRITGGAPLADALAEHPAWFNEVFITAVRVGEVSGNLEEALAELAEHLRVRQDLRNQFLSAITYPAILTIVGLAVVAFLMTYVVPQLLSVLVANDRPLPRSTMALKGLSDAVVAYWWAMAAGIVALVSAAVALYGRPAGRRWVQRRALGLPILGSLLQKSAVSAFAQQMALLLRTGVPFVEAARTIATLSKNLVLRDELENAAEAVESGSDIAPTLEGSRVFPPVVVHLVAVGQDSGELTHMLADLKVRYEAETRLALQRFTHALEPALIVILAGIVGFVVYACMMPIIETTRGIA